MKKTINSKSLFITFIMALGIVLLTLFVSMTTASAEEAQPLMLAKVTRKSNTKQVITYTKIAGATHYEIYGARCGKNYIKYGNAKTTKFTAVHRKKNYTYKYYVLAKKGDATIAKSIEVHAPVKNTTSKGTNAKSATVSPKAKTLNAGQNVVLKTTLKGYNKKKAVFYKGHTKRVRYYSSNNNIATVDSNGVVTAKNVGIVNIYAVAANGVRATAKITVKGNTATSTVKPVEEVVVNVTPTMKKVNFTYNNKTVSKDYNLNATLGTLPAITEFNATEETGKVFEFFTEPEGKGTKITADTKVTSDMTLYGYIRNAKYTVVFHSNYASLPTLPDGKTAPNEITDTFELEYGVKNDAFIDKLGTDVQKMISDTDSGTLYNGNIQVTRVLSLTQRSATQVTGSDFDISADPYKSAVEEFNSVYAKATESKLTANDGVTVDIYVNYLYLTPSN